MPAPTSSRPKVPASAGRAAPQASSAAPLTPYEDYRRRFSNGEKGNLINGRAILEISASIRHQRIEAFLLGLLRGFVQAKGLGEVLASRVLVKIDERNGYEPDVLFVRKERLNIIGEQDVKEAPDLVVEIASRATRKDDRGPKFDGYERLGVPEYWLLDPERREADFFRLEDTEAGPAYRAVALDGGGVFHSAAVPGFRLDPQMLFADPLPSEWDVLRALLEAA